MDKVKVKREALLEKMVANRIAHKEEYEEALEGWRIETKQALKDMAKELEKTGELEDHVLPDHPVEYLADYDRSIAMLEMSTEDELELKEHDFACYVMDNWSWKQHFKMSNTAYVVGARKARARKR